MANYQLAFVLAAVSLVLGPALIIAALVRYTPLLGLARASRAARRDLMALAGLLTLVVVCELSLWLLEAARYPGKIGARQTG